MKIQSRRQDWTRTEYACGEALDWAHIHKFSAAVVQRLCLPQINRGDAGNCEVDLLAFQQPDPVVALISVRASLNRLDAADFRNYWNFWMMTYSRVRTLPGFKALLRQAGIVDYWRKTGNWGDFCKPAGTDDLECR